MANSLTAERRNKLAQILVSKGSVKVGELAEMLEVSTETIRKDLIYLQSEGIAKKSHGGAVASSGLLERPLSARSLENVDAKAKIAQAAIEMIPNNGVIILDSGSTTYNIAKLLTIKKGITVITNSISIVQVLSGTDNKTYSLGGEMRGSSMALVGLWTINALSLVNADIAFLATDGFLFRAGPCTASFDEAEVKKAMVRSSKKSVVVCDNSKFKKDALIQFCEWKEIDQLITDQNAPESGIKELSTITSVKIAGE
ncbi:MAG: DeoR/GlpR family DNA-binding transcription regulator [Clostridia bacterium]|nr:DeoR/GlpR family DNA-binding transcription regulator [Clostridia bacterium]